MRDDKGNYYVIRDYATSNTASWTPGAVGNKTLYVKVKDSTGKEVTKEMAYTVKSSLTVSSFTADKASPQASGTKITLKATATGTGLQYKFFMRDDKGNYYVIRNYATSNTVAWTPGAVGTKTLYVDVKDNTGKVVRKEMLYKVTTPLTVSSFTTDKVSPQVSGTKITLKAAATGNGTLQYKFFMSDDKGNYYVIRNYATSNTASWTPVATGNKTLYVKVKDSTGKEVTKAMAYTVKSNPPVVSSFVSSKAAPQPAGTQMILTAKASGTGTLQYKFLVCDEKSNWSVIQQYSTSNIAIWTPATVGTKTLYVDVKDSNGTVTRKSMSYKVASIAKPVISSFTTDLASPQESGTKVTLKATATGTGALQYKFVIRDEKGNYYILRDYSSSNTFEWQTGSVGAKALIVNVKDSYGSTVSKEIAYTVKAKSSVNIASMYVSKPSPQPVGSGLAINTVATGTGTVTYKYSIYTASTGWQVLSNYSTSSFALWNPTKADSYKIKVEVKDSTGTVESKIIDYKIQ